MHQGAGGYLTNLTPLQVFWWLVVAHALCDFPLQGDFLARAKNHRQPLPGIPWWQCLTAHAVIQGGMVALVTANIILGLFEVFAHWFIDFGKSEGLYGFGEDQGLHIVCKLLWFAAFLALR